MILIAVATAIGLFVGASYLPAFPNMPVDFHRAVVGLGSLAIVVLFGLAAAIYCGAIRVPAGGNGASSTNDTGQTHRASPRTDRSGPIITGKCVITGGHHNANNC